MTWDIVKALLIKDAIEAGSSVLLVLLCFLGYLAFRGKNK